MAVEVLHCVILVSAGRGPQGWWEHQYAMRVSDHVLSRRYAMLSLMYL